METGDLDEDQQQPQLVINLDKLALEFQQHETTTNGENNESNNNETTFTAMTQTTAQTTNTSLLKNLLKKSNNNNNAKHVKKLSCVSGTYSSTTEDEEAVTNSDFRATGYVFHTFITRFSNFS